MFYKLVDYLSNNLYLSVVLATAIALVIFFIVGTIRERKEAKILEEKRNENKIDAPYTRKEFVQGEKIEKQIITTYNEEHKNMKNAIILAAGFGKRMKSDLPKGAINFLDKPMVKYPVLCLKSLGYENIVVIVGHKKEIIEDILKDDSCKFETQEVLNGTAKAVEAAKPSLETAPGDTIILSCDMPLVSERLINELYEYHKSNFCDLTVLSCKVENPFSYGRIVRDSYGSFCKITEELDCNNEEKKINEINSGVYMVKNSLLFDALSKVKNDNKKGEYYLTDIIEIMLKEDKKVEAFLYDDALEVSGINDMETLVNIENIYKEKYNKR